MQFGSHNIIGEWSKSRNSQKATVSSASQLKLQALRQLFVSALWNMLFILAFLLLTLCGVVGKYTVRLANTLHQPINMIAVRDVCHASDLSRIALALGVCSNKSLIN